MYIYMYVCVHENHTMKSVTPYCYQIKYYQDTLPSCLELNFPLFLKFKFLIEDTKFPIN